MNRYLLYLLTLFSILPLYSCQTSKQQTNELDNKSYINDFELIQQNTSNDTRINIISPKAILDPNNNDIEIFDSSILIMNKNDKQIEIKSGKSTLNNTINLIKVYKNVNISFLNEKDSFINTSSFDWDLNTSNINLNRPLDINIRNIKILSSDGIYNIDSKELMINNNNLKTSIYNDNQNRKFQIEVVSDRANWFEKNNSLQFSSIEKQVETTINILNIK